MSNKTTEIVTLLSPTVAALGLELLGVEYLPAPGRSMLRLYIDVDAAAPGADPEAGASGQAASGQSMTADARHDGPEANRAPRAVTIQDCEAVSREVSAMLDVHDPISGEYTLEVSSPGIDRPLFSAAQYLRFIGEQAKLTLALPVEGRRRFQGRIVAVEDGVVVLALDDARQIRVPIENIDKARLAPDLVALGLVAAPRPAKPGRATPKSRAR